MTDFLAMGGYGLFVGLDHGAALRLRGQRQREGQRAGEEERGDLSAHHKLRG